MSDGGAAAAVAAMAQAVKASGAIVRMEPEEFSRLLSKQESPLVVQAVGGLLSANYQYLLGYKGLVFFTKSPEPLALPPRAEVVTARSIWIPA